MPANGQAAAAAQLNNVFGNGLNQKLAAGRASDPGQSPTTPVGYQNEAQQAADGNGPAKSTKTTTTAPSPGGIIGPLPTDIIPNPMHQFPSWTYYWSLWWMDPDDFNDLINANDAGPGLNLPLPNSYVIAEDAGVYTNQRMPTQLGLNYNIQQVELNSTVALNSTSKSSNITDGTMTVIEPYGVTFLDSIIRGTQRLLPGINHNDIPYMLQLDFVGYDDAGNPLPASQTGVYRKRFPIAISDFKIAVSKKGAEYNISFTSFNAVGHSEEFSTTPKDITVTAGTVQEFFDGFASQINDHLRLQVQKASRQFADIYQFKIDPAIAKSKIAYSKQMSLAQGNPKAGGIDLSKGTFNIAYGTQIVDVINRVLGQSSYLIEQLGLDLQSTDTEKIKTSLTQILNTFRTTIKTECAGADSAGNVTTGKKAFDNAANRFSKRITYSVLQYTTFEAKHPAAPLFSDCRPYVSKGYNYIYTGENIDIINLDLHFDKSWYATIAGYTNTAGANTPTSSTGVDAQIANFPTILLSPQLLMASGVIPQTTTLTPLRYKIVVNDQRDNIGMNIIDNPAAQTSVNMLRSLYSNLTGDMLSTDLQIVGDPTLLKQDDWLYTPDPTITNNYTGSLNQFQFAKKFGHVRMDNGELVVSLTVNTPLDIDTDLGGNQGLVFPQPGMYPSLFSGYYNVRTIKSTFANGKFEQILSLNRYFNSDFTAAAAPSDSANGRPSSSSVSTSQKNQNSTNKTTETGPAYDPTRIDVNGNAY
jgi:hypothetical protein